MKTLAALTLCVSSLAQAEPWHWSAGELAIGAGYEIESLGEMTQASVTKVSGLRLLARFDGIALESGTQSDRPRLRFAFGASFLSLDPDPSLSAIGLQRAADASTVAATFRKVVATPVEATYQPWNGPVFFRGRGGTLDYDREKGFWDWRAIELQTVVTHTFHLRPELEITAELGAGVSLGGVEISYLSALERALMLSHHSDEAVTIDPLANGVLALRGHGWSVGFVAAIEQRLDVTGHRPKYEGRLIDAQSQKGRVELVGEYVIWSDAARGGNRKLSAVLETGVEFDNLTVIRMLFGTSDAFIAFQSLLGVRIHF